MLYKLSHAEAFENKFDPVIKIAKVNTGLSYENISSTRVPDAVPKFQGHQHLGSEEEDF